MADAVDACTLWAADEATPVAELLVARGWLTAAERGDIDRLVARKLAKHHGDVKASPAEAAGGGGTNSQGVWSARPARCRRRWRRCV